MGFNPFTSTPALGVQAATPVAGYSLVNGTGNIIQWTTPNDGKSHTAMVSASMDITSGQTGGQITVAYTLPDGTSGNHTLFSPNTGVGIVTPVANFSIEVQANSTVTIAQASALTVGAAVMWAKIWGY